MHFHPDAKLPSFHPLLVGSTPASAVDKAAAKAFANPPPHMTQPAEMTTEQLKVEGRTSLKLYETGYSRFVAAVALFETRWHELGQTRDLACNEMFGCGLNALHKRLAYGKQRLDKAVESPCLSPEEDKKNTLARVADLPEPPDPLADLEEKPAVHAGPAPEPEPVAAPKAVPERTRAAPTESGKPVYALAVWKDLLDFYGHALSRLSDANRAVPDPKLYQTMEAQTKDLMNKSRAWREKGRK